MYPFLFLFFLFYNTTTHFYFPCTRFSDYKALEFRYPNADNTLDGSGVSRCTSRRVVIEKHDNHFAPFHIPSDGGFRRASRLPSVKRTGRALACLESRNITVRSAQSTECRLSASVVFLHGHDARTLLKSRFSGTALSTFRDNNVLLKYSGPSAEN